MTNQQIPITCENCSAPVKFIPAGISRKTGKPYNEFYSCSNRCGWVWRPDKKQIPKSGVEKESPRDAILLEEIQALRKEVTERLDKLGIYLKSKLEE